jgi:hypothetical protein
MAAFAAPSKYPTDMVHWISVCNLSQKSHEQVSSTMVKICHSIIMSIFLTMLMDSVIVKPAYATTYVIIVVNLPFLRRKPIAIKPKIFTED